MKPDQTLDSSVGVSIPRSSGRRLDFSRTNGRVDELIDLLLELTEVQQDRDLVREMVLTALKAGHECDARAELKLMTSTLKEMRFTAKVFSAYRSTRKITVFGSARTGSNEPVYRMASELGRNLVNAGYMVITGAGPGIMQAVNEGAGPDHSFGVRIRLPFEPGANPVVNNNPRLINYKYFFNRKVAFIKEADAVVLFPGGFGTLDEAMEILTLLQTGKRYPLPLILVEPPGGTYWSSKVAFMKRELLTPGYIDPADLELFETVYSTQEAVRAIARFYRRYHSMRFVGDKLVLRLHAALDPQQLARIQTDFDDVLIPGGQIVVSTALPEERNDHEILELPRLLLDFNRRDFARLRRLIDTINE